MSNVFADRVQETTSTTGTGTITTAGAVSQYQSFSSGIGNGNTCDYCLLSGNGTDWETGNGTVTVSGGTTTVSRDTVYASSNSGSKINLSGTSNIFGTIAAPRFNAWSPWGPAIGVPRPTSSNTGLTSWANQNNGASVADTAVGITLTQPSAGVSDDWSVRYKSAPGTPYSFTALVALTAASSGIIGIGLGFYDGTKLQLIRLIQNGNVAPTYYVSNFSTTSSFSSNPFAGSNFATVPIWFKIYNDGTNLKYYSSFDGVNFLQVYTNTITNFLANANNVCIAIEANAGTGYGSIMSWSQGTS